MSAKIDLLGRRPAMRPASKPEQPTDYQRPVRGGKMVIGSGRTKRTKAVGETGAPDAVNVSAPPWMEPTH